jgi:hypothetical protein
MSSASRMMMLGLGVWALARDAVSSRASRDVSSFDGVPFVHVRFFVMPHITLQRLFGKPSGV